MEYVFRTCFVYGCEKEDSGDRELPAFVGF